MISAGTPADQAGRVAVAEAYVVWKDWREDSFATFSLRDAHYFTWHVTRAVGGGKAGLQVLEIGFGNGGFLGWARQQGHTAAGVEFSEELVSRARGAGFAAYSRQQDIDPQARFDLVAAFDVLEHVPSSEAEAFLSGLAARLAPGGRIVLRFPNAESPFGQWYQNGDVTHVSALGLSRLRQLSPRCGLQVLHWGERLPWQCEPARGRLPAATYHLARRLFERLVRKMYGLDRGMDFTPNQLVVLAAATDQGTL